MSYLKDENKNYYKALNFFMMRNPVLSFEVYKDIFESNLSEDKMLDKLISMANNSEIKEAIIVSSLSLNEAIDRLNSEKDINKKDKIIQSIFKYIVRMSTRTTPYGLFSGVTTGRFGQSTELKINNIKQHKKRARPDMEWLYGVMRMLENNENILNKLKVKANPITIINGNRLDIPYISNYGQAKIDPKSNNINASIRFTTPVKMIMEEASKQIPFNELLIKIKRKFENIPDEVIKSFIYQLLKNEYIITDIRPPLVNTDSFTYLLDRIKDIDESKYIYEILYEIKELIDEYNCLPIGEGIDKYKILVEKMKTVFKCSNYLQVDLNINSDKVILNEKIADEVTDVIEFLIRISGNRGEAYNIAAYKEEFMEFYGTCREVPVVELLDEDKGLGAPAGYLRYQSIKQLRIKEESEHEKNFKTYMFRKIEECLLMNQNEIILREEDLEIMGGRKFEEIHLHEMPKSLDAYVMVHSRSAEDLDNGNFKMYISPNPGVTGAGRTFGRFIDILPKEIYENMNVINEEEKNIYGEGYILAEIVELPQEGRTSNVTLNWNAREYEIVIADNYSNKKKKIDIKDLYIGIDQYTQKFYIKSKTFNKRIIATSGHMLNILIGSNIYRFIREISQQNTIEVFEKIYKNGLESFAYIPRIVYKKTVIIPATWKISMSTLKLNEKSDFKKFMDKLEIWKTNYNVPQYVYQKVADNRLLLNLDNYIHINELFRILKSKSNEEIILNEVEDGIENLLLEGDDGGYFSEFVIPLVLKKDKYIELEEKRNILTNEHNIIKNQSELGTFSEKRQIFFGNEWIYIKLYGNSKRVEEFLGFQLLEFCNKLKEDGIIEKFFFLRYGDPERHIRLRLKCNKVDERVMVILNNWFNNLRDEGLLTRVVFDTYYKEIERYGGERLIELAEDVFAADSLLVLKLINLKRSGKLDLDTNLIAISNIINILDNLGIDYDTQRLLFENRFDRNSNRDLFKKNRKIFIDAANSYNKCEKLRNIEGGEVVYNLFKIRSEALHEYSKKLREVEKQEGLSNSKVNILFSLTHMFCNRFIGENSIEELIMNLIRHSLHSLEYVRKQYKDKVEH